MPAIRNGRSGISRMVVMARLAPPGNAARRMPSIAKNKPSAARKSCIGREPISLKTLFRGTARSLRHSRHRRARNRWSRGRSSCLRRHLPRGVDKKAEELGIRPQHQMRIGMQHAPLVSLHRAIKGEEIRILAEGLGIDTVSLGVALAADLLGLRGRVGCEHGDVAIGLGADFLALLAALGAEFGRFALPFGLHALKYRLAVLFRQIDATDAYVDDMDTERLRVAVELIAHLAHQFLALVAHGIRKRRRAEHAPQRRVE